MHTNIIDGRVLVLVGVVWRHWALPDLALHVTSIPRQSNRNQWVPFGGMGP
jgi:hypothetical protein